MEKHSNTMLDHKNHSGYITLTILVDPESPELRKEHMNSLTRLLAATIAYKLQRNYGGGVTQCKYATDIWSDQSN